jgi:hypothetical protein
MKTIAKILWYTKIFVILISSACLLVSNISYGKSRWNLWNNPTVVLDNLAQNVNQDRIQDNALNDISNIQGQYSSEYKISNTLDALRKQITPYLQWTMYLGFSIAVILIIYNGFLMVTNWLHDWGSSDKVKWRIKNIVIGVFILSWFYLLIQLLLSVITYILE